MVVAQRSGNSCRLAAALFAVPAPAEEDGETDGDEFRRLPRFSQFPPATLFAAIRRSAARSLAARTTASGTGLAMGWLAARAFRKDN
jgi:hypothetical protein